ncbi:MAG: hypothetical protein IPG80_20790 [Anaerolineales bacterium]|uniref:hypothetical protein n=1 Tax=Candidatus Villigracilis vicinus TaxID=3140679 RepID=UPI003136506A|nr:hypothetical protein [Anaerolineales bacterium]
MSSEALPVITKSSSEFKLDAYASIPAGELVVFAVQVLQADAAPVAVEEIVSTCFRFFPHSFALKNYFYWPDSALVTRRLHDAKEKGLLKGSPAEGFEVKGKGRQVARQTAKALRVSLPMPPKVEEPAPVIQKEETPVPVKVEEKVEAAPRLKEKPIQSVKTDKKVQPAKTIEKKQVKKTKKPTAKPKVKPKAETAKVIAPVKKKPAPKPKPSLKKTVKLAAKVKAQPKPNQIKTAPKSKGQISKPAVKVKAKVPKKEQVKAAPVAKIETPKVQKTKNAQATQMTMALTPPPAAWKKAEAPAIKPKVKEEAKQPVKVEVLAPVAASKEEKDKAAKVIKQIERSDAYQLYRRNGKRAQIGEFDFRNMLFATMESSAETLKRNVELFKRYAGIHFRTDLIAFLEFCEESFSNLLISKVKGKK